MRCFYEQSLTRENGVIKTFGEIAGNGLESRRVGRSGRVRRTQLRSGLSIQLFVQSYLNRVGDLPVAALGGFEVAQ